MKTLTQLCDEIIAGYAAEKSGLDDDMIDLVLELADKAEDIKQLTNIAWLACQWYDTGIGKCDAAHQLEMAVMRYKRATDGVIASGEGQQ